MSHLCGGKKDALGIVGLRITIQNLYGMRQFIFAILFLTICMGLPFGCAQQAQTADEEADRMAIEQVIDQYITSINRCDTSIVNRIWSHGDEVSFIAPSGYYATKLDGTPHDTKGRETQIFERSADGSWRLVHIHYSGVGSR